MNAELGHALPPRMTRREAERRLRGGVVQRALGRELRSLALLYLPYHLYDVTITRAGRARDSRYAGDALTGSLDPYEADSLPEPLPPPVGRNVLPAVLTAQEGAARLRDQLRRVVYQRGFFGPGAAEITVRPAGKMIWVPYWAGFCGRGGRAHVRVLDGLRGTLEGPKAREVILQWLTS